MLKYIIYFSFLLTAGFSSMAQTKKEIKKQYSDSILRLESEGIIVFKSQVVGGLKLYTNGYGVFLEYGKAKSTLSNLLFQLDVSEIKAVNEGKSSIAPNSKSFIYGKINFLYPVRLGVQYEKVLGVKSKRNGVMVSANLGGGITGGFLRPYYLQLIDTAKNTSYFAGVKGDTSKFENSRFILGGPRFKDGWSALKLVPGFYGKFGLRFDAGDYNNTINGIEVGAIGEYYTQKIPLMLHQKERQFFYSLYVSLILGSRKTKK